MSDDAESSRMNPVLTGSSYSTNNIFFRKFVREFKMPEGVLHDQISSSYSSDGILTISAPRVINAPGASYS